MYRNDELPITDVQLPLWEPPQESTEDNKGVNKDDATVDSQRPERDDCHKECPTPTCETPGVTDSEDKEEKPEDDASTNDQDDSDMLPQMDTTSLSVPAGNTFCVTVFGKDKKRVDAVKPFEHPDVIVLGQEQGSYTDDNGNEVHTNKFSFRIQNVGRYELMKCGFEYLHVNVVPGPVFVPRSSWEPEDDKRLAAIGHVCAVNSSVRYIFHPRDEFGNPTTIDQSFVKSLSIKKTTFSIKLDVECVGDSGVRLSFIPLRECFVQCIVLFGGKEYVSIPPISIVALNQSALHSLDSMSLGFQCSFCWFRGDGRDNTLVGGEQLLMTVNQNKVVVFKHFFSWFGRFNYYPFGGIPFDINQSLEVTAEFISREQKGLIILKQSQPWKELKVEMEISSAFQVVAAIKLSLIKQTRCGSMERRVGMLKDSLLSIVGMSKPVDVTIERDNILDDAMRLFSAYDQKELLMQRSITFKGEDAIDAGGPSKEFFTTLYTLLFGPDGGLWTTPDRAIRYPSPPPSKRLCISSGSTSEVAEGSLVPYAFTQTPYSSNVVAEFSLRPLYELCGVLVARAVADYVLGRNMPQIPFAIASSVFKFILSQPVEVADLAHDDPAYWRSKVQFIMNNSIDDLGVKLTEDMFTMDNQIWGTVCIDPEDPNYYGSFCSAERIVEHARSEKQESREVTDKTKQVYLDELAKYRLQGAMREHLTWFRDGFVRVLGYDNAMMFSPCEYMMMCCSSCAGKIDIQDLRAHAVFPFDSPVVGWLWQALSIFCDSEKRKFLIFVTGLLSPPSGGFKNLRPSFTIRVTDKPVSQLPVSHTCFNILELPAYNSYQDLFAKLLLAINEGNGSFGIE